ncbi:MAG: ATP-binding cassette domain-containing protein [Candidatus Bipolaricaulota bacterium]|nr:ATP-binding cassette domain-containing protein [Candidatus Bipolaricaulota bacterium]MDW8126429.1 ATP-binding cassette domain-containing protein [Candidatus Bipolaricaulota bacterium]
MLAIQVAELRFATEEGVLVFDRLSFGVPRDGFVWLVGPAGSGKTLILRILLGEVRPHGGQILLLGRNILRVSAKKFQELRRKVGYMPEELRVLPRHTVLGNLQFKLRALGVTGEVATEAIERALDLAQLRGREREYPENLSSFELKCLDLALALCPECSVLLVDDPLRNLTPEAQDAFLSVLIRTNQAGVTILGTSREVAPLRRAGFSPSGGTQAIVYLREGVSG